tara:strand:+ start:3072 stop:3599 length:528 start_codon:yes stop_codon:yes gene_type:complete
MTLNIRTLLIIIVSITSGCTARRIQKSIDESIASSNVNQLDSLAFVGPLFLEKTACFGPCPAFQFYWNETQLATITITRPFREGPLSTLSPGNYQGVVTMEKVRLHSREIQAATQSCRYEELEPLYDNPRVTDLPATITEINGTRVTNRYGGPDLNNLYLTIQTLIDGIEWSEID